MKRLFTNLVTARPPREVKGEAFRGIVQELSSQSPVLHVPQEDTALAERERMLLLYDAAFTPHDLPGAYGLESWALDAARVIRASKLAAENLPPATRPTDEERNVMNEVSGKYLANAKYEQHKATLAKYEALTGEPMIPTYLRERIEATDWTSWEETVGFAKQLVADAEARAEPPMPPPPGKSPDKGNPGEDSDPGDMPQPDDSWLDGDGDDSSKDEDEAKAPESAEAKAEKQLQESVLDNPETGAKPRISKFNPDPWHKGKIPKKSSDTGRPGILENPDSPDVLPMEPRRKRLGYKRRPEMEGVVPMRLHRYLVDRKIFGGVKKFGGLKGRGTVLVDMSGSMCWTPEDFEELLTLLPECTVYGYSGDAGGTKGRLVLLADRGKAAKMGAISDWNRFRGSNLVDDSCLRFLGKCSAPRIWISDGGVTGCGDRRSAYITTLCNAAIVAGNILRARTVHEAIKKLSRKTY